MRWYSTNLCLCDVAKLRRTAHGEKDGSVTGALGTIGQYVQGIFDFRALASTIIQIEELRSVFQLNGGQENHSRFLFTLQKFQFLSYEYVLLPKQLLL